MKVSMVGEAASAGRVKVQRRRRVSMVSLAEWLRRESVELDTRVRSPHDTPSFMDEHCDNSGRCVAPIGARGIANCIYCGKELVERGGHSFTCDADLLTDSPRPQKCGLRDC